MPVYEYKCTEEDCGKEQDRVFSMKDKPQEFEDKCDGCGRTVKLKAILSPSALSGFQDMQGGDRIY